MFRISGRASSNRRAGPPSMTSSWGRTGGSPEQDWCAPWLQTRRVLGMAHDASAVRARSGTEATAAARPRRRRRGGLRGRGARSRARPARRDRADPRAAGTAASRRAARSRRARSLSVVVLVGPRRDDLRAHSHRRGRACDTRRGPPRTVPAGARTDHVARRGTDPPTRGTAGEGLAALTASLHGIEPAADAAPHVWERIAIERCRLLERPPSVSSRCSTSSPTSRSAC